MTPKTESALQGAKASVPLSLAVLPFGLVYGAVVAESSLSASVGAAASWIILAGAAQLTVVGLIDDQASWLVVIGAGLVINLRFSLYSAALAPSFSTFGRRWRYGLAYLMTDQATTLWLQHAEQEADPERRQWYNLGAGLTFVIGWWLGTVLGVVVGDLLPESLGIRFAVPAMFIALVMPSLTERPSWAAAAVGGCVAVVAAGLPSGLNVISGAVIGVAVGIVLQIRQDRR